MRRRMMWIIGSGLAAVTLLSGFIGGGCGRRGWGHHGGQDSSRAERFINWKVDDHLDELNATEAQRKRVHELKDGLIADGKKLHEEQRNVRGELVAQWDSATPDANRVHALVDERVDAFRGFAHKVADAVLEVHALFTPEQRKQVSDELHSRMQR